MRLNRYLLTLLWLIGLLVLLIIGHDVENTYRVQSSQTYRLNGEMWANWGVSFVWGLYLSLLFVRRWKFQIHLPLLLCVFVPCVVLSLAPIVSLYTHGFVPFWIIQVNETGILPLVSGIAAICGLFGSAEQTS